MSKLRQQSGDDHPEAAGKHLDDATVLLGSTRLDGAAYLAGYVVECSLKTIIMVEKGRYSRIHDLNKLSSDALKLASLPSSKTARYSSGISGIAAIKSWKETIRYYGPGQIPPSQASDWVREARTVYKTTIVPMKLDGVI